MPKEALGPKATPSAAANIALMKYGGGFPFYRLSKIQEYLKTPISPSAIWRMLDSLYEIAVIIWNEIRRQAAQGEIIHNDDTTNKVLALMPKRKDKDPVTKKTKEKGKRKAIYTSGILSKLGAIRIMLFYTGHQTAGENLESLLKERDVSLSAPKQMSDGSNMNHPKTQKTVPGECVTHLRRYFVKSYRTAKKASAFVILKLKIVYKVERQAVDEKLSPEERLKLHQEKSKPIMDELEAWMKDQRSGKNIEDNSPLGEALNYMYNHWEKLTQFLKIPGMPLTNDELEQKFKMVKTFLKNSLFYKTILGAKYGDVFMSIIHTCVLANESPFEYLVAIQEHRSEVMLEPSKWMPWNYQENLPITQDLKQAA